MHYNNLIASHTHRLSLTPPAARHLHSYRPDFSPALSQHLQRQHVELITFTYMYCVMNNLTKEER